VNCGYKCIWFSYFEKISMEGVLNLSEAKGSSEDAE
jgi:hypothetical protein